MHSPGFNCLYEEGPCLIVSKPAGLLTQAPPGIDSLEVRIKDFLRRRDHRKGKIYLGVPHRLDRPVSGCIAFGKNGWSVRRISEQFEGRLVRKLYWACVKGEVTPSEGTWIDHIRKVPDEARAEIVPADHPEGRPAVLHYREIGKSYLGTWLEIELETGRTHQIRIQLANRGWPILGDAQYGSRVPFGVQHDDPRQNSIALHGRSLTLRHPLTQQMIAVEAPLPSDWDALGLKLNDGVDPSGVADGAKSA